MLSFPIVVHILTQMGDYSYLAFNFLYMVCVCTDCNSDLCHKNVHTILQIPNKVSKLSVVFQQTTLHLTFMFYNTKNSYY